MSIDPVSKILSADLVGHGWRYKTPPMMRTRRADVAALITEGPCLHADQAKATRGRALSMSEGHETRAGCTCFRLVDGHTYNGYLGRIDAKHKPQKENMQKCRLPVDYPDDPDDPDSRDHGQSEVWDIDSSSLTWTTLLD